MVLLLRPFLVLLFCVAFFECCSSELAPFVRVSPAKKDDKLSLRRTLFGGEPHLSFCADKSNKGLDDFISNVRKYIGESTNKVRTAKIECDEVLSSGQRTLRKSLKLKKTQPGEPVVLWSVNGDKPKQLPMNVYTSPVKAPKKKKGDKKKDSKSVKPGSVQLDPKKLSAYALKERRPKLKALTAVQSFEKHCLGRKYQLCGVITHKGKLNSKTQKFWLKVANLHRSVRFFSIDTSKYQLSIPGKGTKNDSSKLGLNLFRRSDYLYSGAASELKNADDATSEAEKKKLEEKYSKMKVPVDVPSLGPKVRVSLALNAVIQNSDSPKKRLVEFRKREVEAQLDFNFEGRKDEIIILVRDGSNGYFLDWDHAASFLISKNAFDAVYDASKLEELQFRSLTKASSKVSKDDRNVEYILFDGNAENGPEVSNFLKSAILPKFSMSTLTKKPNMIKKGTSTSTSSTRKSSSRRKPKKKRASTKKASGSTVSSKERVERERKRRQEMEEEALEVGAVPIFVGEEETESCDNDAGEIEGMEYEPESNVEYTEDFEQDSIDLDEEEYEEEEEEEDENDEDDDEDSLDLDDVDEEEDEDSLDLDDEDDF